MPHEFYEVLQHCQEKAKKKTGITLVQLAKVMDVPVMTLRSWLEGNFKPRKDKRKNIERGLRCLRCSEQEINVVYELLDWPLEFPIVDDLAEAIFPNFTSELFENLSKLKPILLVLSQSNWGEPPLREALLRKAQNQFLPQNVLRAFLPVNLDFTTDTYFADLGEQCNFDNVHSASDFESNLRHKLKSSSSEKLFLLVSCFEQGNYELRRQFASIVSALTQQFVGKFYVVCCGGEKLLDMKYRDGDVSLLSQATVKYWEEIGEHEVQAMWEHCYCKKYPQEMEHSPEIDPLDEFSANKILEISGGHPQLLYDCLHMKYRNSSLTVNQYEEYLIQVEPEYLWSTFLPLMEEEKNRKRLYELLEDESLLGVKSKYIVNDFTRRLFWKNLLTYDKGNRLRWRCEIIKKVGKKILEEKGV